MQSIVELMKLCTVKDALNHRQTLNFFLLEMFKCWYHSNNSQNGGSSSSLHGWGRSSSQSQLFYPIFKMWVWKSQSNFILWIPGSPNSMEKKIKKAITYFIRKLLSPYFSRIVGLDIDDLNPRFFRLYSNSIAQKVCGYTEIMAIPSIWEIFRP